MNNHHEQFTRDLQGVSLTSEEHQAMRRTLQAAIQLQSAPAGIRGFFMRHVAACSVAVFVLFAGTTAGAAQNALPGDFLYPIRIGINERIALVVAGGEEARMERELAQLERALDEEELVAVYALADLIVVTDDDKEQVSEQTAVSAPSSATPPEQRTQIDSSFDSELDVELRALEHLLENEEDAAAEIERSL
jgi:hypothetical protein